MGAVKADKDLNAAYAGVIDPLVQQAKDGGAECLKPVEPIRAAERAWIVYRDAWVRFAKVRWPEVSEDSWLTFLSEERVRRMASYPGQ